VCHDLQGKAGGEREMLGSVLNKGETVPSIPKKQMHLQAFCRAQLDMNDRDRESRFLPVSLIWLWRMSHGMNQRPSSSSPPIGWPSEGGPHARQAHQPVQWGMMKFESENACLYDFSCRNSLGKNGKCSISHDSELMNTHSNARRP
jgi:hypothetical protein